MTEGEFLKDWVNDTKNEYNEKEHHEYSEREVLDMLRKWKEQLKQKIEEDIYLNVCDCEPEQCKKIEGKCKNLAYR